jgi:hypothetical protein
VAVAVAMKLLATILLLPAVNEKWEFAGNVQFVAAVSHHAGPRVVSVPFSVTKVDQ